MAKKTAKKAGRARARAGARKGGGKISKRGAATGSSGGRRGGGGGPVPVKVGGGPSPGEIGRAVVGALNAGRPDRELWARWWHKNAESIEGEGVAMAWRGMRAIQAKGEEWTSTHIIHGASAEGPYVGATGFAVKFRMDVEDTGTGQRHVMEELGVYSVQKGKIVREEFFYGTKQPVNPGGRAEEELDGLPASETARPMA